MQLNVKNEEAYTLAKELSRLTGDKMTKVVIDALRERLTTLSFAQKEAAADKLQNILSVAQHCADLPEQDARPVEDILYDPQGLPKDGAA